uniref:(California timema) hypothetical protein n=1 Tax=Timema californicum TaxID=61474 RepID=A0A7R9IZU9_TIMCA|nr:unnamed protein product [Timema californicum]
MGSSKCYPFHEPGQVMKWAAPSAIHSMTWLMNLSAFATGVVIGWPSPMLPLLQQSPSPLGDDVDTMSADSSSWLGSLMCVGGLLATPAYSYMGNRHSRKLTGYLVGLPGVIGWLLVLTARSELMLFAGRLFLGFGGAGNTILCPLYVMEIVEDDIRGSLGTYLVLFTNAGILFAYVMGSYASYTTFSSICLAVPITFMASFFWLPETPVYLFNQNNPVAARRALQWLRGGDVVIVEQEMTKLVEAADKGKDNRSAESSFIKNLTSKGTLKGLLIGVGLMVNNQLSGIFAVISYTVNIFQDAGSDISPNLCTIMVGVLQLFGVYLTSTLIDRAGRKILLIVSNIASAVCLAALGSFFYLKGHGYDVTDIGWLPVTSLSVYVVAIALGVGSIPFIVINEIFTPQMRGFAVTVCICLLNALAFLVARFFTDLSLLLGLDGCYWFFALCCLASAFFCYFVVPETKNKSLDSILKDLAGEEITIKKADERIKVPV